MSASMCVEFVSGVRGSQKKALNALELDLQTVVDCHVDGENQGLQGHRPSSLFTV